MVATVRRMKTQMKIVGSILVAMVLLIIILAIECGYIQYGFGKVHFVHPTDYQLKYTGVCSI